MQSGRLAVDVHLADHGAAQGRGQGAVLCQRLGLGQREPQEAGDAPGRVHPLEEVLAAHAGLVRQVLEPQASRVELSGAYLAEAYLAHVGAQGL